MALPKLLSWAVFLGSVGYTVWFLSWILTTPIVEGQGWFVTHPSHTPGPAQLIGLLGLLGVAFATRDKLASVGLAILGQIAFLMDLVVAYSGRDAGALEIVWNPWPDFLLNGLMRPFGALFVLIYVFGGSRRWLWYGAALMLLTLVGWQIADMTRPPGWREGP